MLETEEAAEQHTVSLYSINEYSTPHFEYLESMLFKQAKHLLWLFSIPQQQSHSHTSLAPGLRIVTVPKTPLLKPVKNPVALQTSIQASTDANISAKPLPSAFAIQKAALKHAFSKRSTFCFSSFKMHIIH